MYLKNSLPIALLFTFALLPHFAHAERNLILLGGGGEPKNINNTIFDNTLVEMDKYLSNNKWRTLVAFNGGHSQTEALLTMKLNDAVVKTSFSQNNFNTIVAGYIEKIRKGDIKSGEQLMVMIDTHGAPKISSDPKSAHQIAAGMAPSTVNPNDLSGTPTVSLGDLQVLSDIAKTKGIKLAILDFSCYSGNSLSLANENTCVISSTGPGHFGYSSFSEAFIKKMNTGKSLEDVFLAVRKETRDSSFPMISSAEGNMINQNFYPAITPYLYYYEREQRLDKMTDYLIGASTNVGVCQRKNQFDDLMKQLESIRAVNALNANKAMPELDRIKFFLSEYKSAQDRYINLLRSWGTHELNRKETFIGSVPFGKRQEQVTANYTWQELIETDYERIIKNLSKSKLGTKDPRFQAQFQASIEMHKKAQAKQAEILSRYPNLKTYKENFAEALKNFQGTLLFANKIAQEERKLYDNLYNNLRQENKTTNPCRSFML